MSLDPKTNFAQSALSAGIAAGDGSMSLVSAANFPTPGTDGAFNGTIWNGTDYTNAAQDPDAEIVRVTAGTGAPFSITRAQEGTADVNHNTAGKTYYFTLGITAKDWSDLKEGVAATGTTYDATDASGVSYTVTTGLYTALADGIELTVKPSADNTSNSLTINLDGLGARGLYRPNGDAVAVGEFDDGGIYRIRYDGTRSIWMIMSSTIGGEKFATFYYSQATDNSAAADAFDLSMNYDFGSVPDGMMVVFKAAYTNTGAATAEIDGLLAAKDILKVGGSELEAGDIQAGDVVFMTWDQGDDHWHLISAGVVGISKPYGEMYMQANSTETTITAVDTPAKAAGTTTAGELLEFTHTPSNRLVYANSVTRMFRVTASLTIGNATTALDIVRSYIAKNGTVIAKSAINRKIGSGGDSGAVSIQCLTSLAPTDYLELWVENKSDASDILVGDFNMIAEAL